MLSELLKTQTKDLHDAVEAKFQSNRIFDKTYSVDQYKTLLRMNYELLREFEDSAFKKISPETAAQLKLNERSKLDAAEKDLKELNINTNKENGSDNISSEAEAFGVLYVMEGSTLGGNVIKKQLGANPNFEGMNFNYFGVYGENTGPLWKNFKEVLDSKFDESQYQEVLNGALKGYNFLKDLPLN